MAPMMASGTGLPRVSGSTSARKRSARTPRLGRPSGSTTLVAVGVTPGLPTLRRSSIDPSTCRPGFGTRISYVWDAEPLGANCSVFVHFLNAKGQMVFQADHDPPTPTSRWTGRIEYSRTANVPTDVPPGRYDVVIGFWNPKPSDRGGGRRPFRSGEGLTAIGSDACRVGTLEVSADAPLPKLPAPTLNLDAYRMTFDEDFRAPLSVSAWGPGTRWIAHTPYAGDFGDAGFADPEKDSPFTIKDGILQIEARKVGDRWRTGLLCSVDPKGEGFSQKYGYFEIESEAAQGAGHLAGILADGRPAAQGAQGQEDDPAGRDRRRGTIRSRPQRAPHDAPPLGTRRLPLGRGRYLHRHRG